MLFSFIPVNGFTISVECHVLLLLEVWLLPIHVSQEVIVVYWDDVPAYLLNTTTPICLPTVEDYTYWYKYVSTLIMRLSGL